MSLSVPGPERIRDYLLRRLSEPERARFEEAYFRDDGLLDQIESEEDHLVTDYVLGRLPDPERRLFEDSLLDTPYYRERVETTRSMRLRLAEERFFRKKSAAAAGVPAFQSSDARLFPGGTGLALAFGFLVLLTVASLASAWFLKSALQRTRQELAGRSSPPTAAETAGVVPIAQTVVLTAGRDGASPIARLKRPPGGAILLVVPRPALDAPGTDLSLALLKDKGLVWESGPLPPKGSGDGDLSVRLPPGVPAAGTYAVRLRALGGSAAPTDVLLGTLDVQER